MSNYPKLTITHGGHDMIAEAAADQKPLIFTRVKIGAGQLAPGQNSETLTDVIDGKMTLSLNSGQKLSTGGAKLRFVVDNSALETGFFAREVAVYAKVGESGTERLYAYTNGGNYVDYIPDKSNPIDAQIIDVYLVTGNAANVQIMVNSSAYATIYDLSDAIAAHNTASDAHENRFAAVMAALGGYLPLAGGVMSGNIILDPKNAYRAGGMAHYRPDGYLEFMGAPDWWKGAALQLYGKDYPRDGFANCFRLSTGNGGSVLLGTPNDGLFWDGIITLGAKNTNRINQIRCAYDDGYFELLGAQSFVGGPSIQMYGNSYTKQSHLTGVMRIGCSNHSLYLCPDGRVMWDNTDIGGSGIVAKMLGETGYIKYASGLIIQWGTSRAPEGNISRILFPIAFTTTKYIVVANASLNADDDRDSVVNIKWGSRTTTQADLFMLSAASCFYIAIGI